MKFFKFHNVEKQTQTPKPVPHSDRVGVRIDSGMMVVAVMAVLIVISIIMPKHKPFDWFKKKELKIEDTKTLVSQIRQIDEFVTAGYCDEMVLYYSKEGTRLLSHSRDEIVIVVKGKVRAGFDLSKVDSTHVKASGDTLWLVLPEPEIFDVVVNPSDIKVFQQDGNWSHSQVAKIEKEACSKLKERAVENGILDKAARVGTSRMIDMLETLGYHTVLISIQDVQKRPLIAPDDMLPVVKSVMSE